MKKDRKLTFQMPFMLLVSGSMWLGELTAEMVFVSLTQILEALKHFFPKVPKRSYLINSSQDKQKLQVLNRNSTFDKFSSGFFWKSSDTFDSSLGLFRALHVSVPFLSTHLLLCRERKAASYSVFVTTWVWSQQLGEQRHHHCLSNLSEISRSRQIIIRVIRIVWITPTIFTNKFCP